MDGTVFRNPSSPAPAALNRGVVARPTHLAAQAGRIQKKPAGLAGFKEISERWKIRASGLYRADEAKRPSPQADSI